MFRNLGLINYHWLPNKCPKNVSHSHHSWPKNWRKYPSNHESLIIKYWFKNEEWWEYCMFVPDIYPSFLNHGWCMMVYVLKSRTNTQNSHHSSFLNQFFEFDDPCFKAYFCQIKIQELCDFGTFFGHLLGKRW